MNFLLEIGTEEIPHWMIPAAVKDLKTFGLVGAAVAVDATPRRLVVTADLPQTQASEVIEVPGPPRTAGPIAAQSFARKMGVTVEDLWIVETPKGEYYRYHSTVPGRPYREVLPPVLRDLVGSIYWPKTMYWVGGKTGPRFIRPIRWIVALLGDDVIPFEIAGVKSGNVTRGHRQLGSSSIPVTIANYESELRKNFVILSSKERREKIETEAAALGAKPDADLLETLTFTTEYPKAIRGDFDPSFLALPAEVLTTVLKHHQKTFSVESAPNLWGPGTLAPHFVAIMNTAADPDGWVKLGNERVIKARFNDAWFFYDLDTKKKLADRVEDLAKVTFHQRLGSYLDKTKRVEEIVDELKGSANAKRAAHLCKADLTTEMVKEFTDLQGVVGGLYAREQQENDFVARAIYEHYQPLNMDSDIPSTVDGQIVALADKLDTLRECFKVGMVPTGSKDPFALRRAAQGVVKILVVANLQYEIDDFVSGELLRFMLDRVKHFFRERGFRYYEVDAVFERGCGILAERGRVLDAFMKMRDDPDFASVCISFKRMKNILQQVEFERPPLAEMEIISSTSEKLTQADRDLEAAYERTNILERDPDPLGGMRAFASLRPTIDAFFNGVMVLDKDSEVRLFRLTRLDSLVTEFSTIADFSKIVTEGDK
jgi:glycyl-tRNA synthetase beta chain